MSSSGCVEAAPGLSELRIDGGARHQPEVVIPREEMVIRWPG